ncbi:MAG TPA: beta-ketoacyl synthase N-terminal-like domain-containing protein [Acidobacteriota bacterium]
MSSSAPNQRRIGIFGWGVVAPRSPTVDAFRANLRQAGMWMEPFDGFGPSNFLVGVPKFDFAVYKPWIDQRFKPAKYAQLEKKMGAPVQYAIGAFIQALGQNPGIETTLRDLGIQTHVYVGTGVGDIPVTYEVAIGYYKAQRRWDRFWAAPERCCARRDFQAASESARAELRAAHAIPPEPVDRGDPIALEEQQEAFDRYWARRSDGLQGYLEQARRIQSEPVAGEVESAKKHAIKHKLIEMKKLQERCGCPTEPWNSISPNLIWNIANTPASQISMLGRLHGPSWAPVGACSGFGLALKLAIDSIRGGHARAAVVGMTDPPPHPLTVGAFYAANVLAADRQASKPLTDLRGTHVAGGACIWIVGDVDYMRQLGYQPVGMELLAVALSSDAEHIITPSKEGPRIAIREAIRQAGIEPEELATWDLHATATPGDYLEVEIAREFVPDGAYLTARKGIFGHGMSVGGGWELTAQHLGVEEGILYPTSLREDELNAEIKTLHSCYVFDRSVPFQSRFAGKINMGIGGINSVIISRRWD